MVGGRLDVHVDAVASALLVLHLAGFHREDGEVAANADVAAGVHLGAHLPDDDVARNDGLAAVNLDAAVLPRGVAPVPRRALSFFVCHGSPPLTGNAGDFELGIGLAVS